MHLLGSIPLGRLRLFVTLASLEVRGSSRPRVRFVRGVVTYDFGINITAVINVVRFLAGTASFDGVDVVDTIDDGFTGWSYRVDVSVFFFTDGEHPPRPFPEEGEDPMPDQLPCRR